MEIAIAVLAIALLAILLWNSYKRDRQNELNHKCVVIGLAARTDSNDLEEKPKGPEIFRKFMLGVLHPGKDDTDSFKEHNALKELLLDFFDTEDSGIREELEIAFGVPKEMLDYIVLHKNDKEGT